MNISDMELFYLTGYSVMLGAALGVCYGLFSFVRVLLSPDEPHGAKGRALCDIAAFVTDVSYSLFAGVCAALMFFGLNSGRVRLIGIVGCATGFCIYHFTLGRTVIALFTRGVGAVRAGIRFVYSHTVGYLVGFVCKVLKRVFRPSGIKIKKRKRYKRKADNERLEFFG